MKKILLSLLTLSFFLPVYAFASSSTGGAEHLQATTNYLAYLCLAFFILAYLLVMTEEITHLKKSKPVIFAAGIIWIFVAIIGNQQGETALVQNTLNHALLEYGLLFLFLLTAMTYINVLEERNVFNALRAVLINKGLSYKGIFWLTGILAFFISPIADNLTTALIMCSVVMAIGKDDIKFVSISCVNIVVAANAGGAFSPFGDITTLMVWQSGILPFQTFFVLFLPSVVNFLIPATIMSFAIPKMHQETAKDNTRMRYGAKTIMVLFLLTIATAVSFENFLHLPPALGMMTGLSYLMFYSHFLRKRKPAPQPEPLKENVDGRFDIFKKVSRAEWDTLLFFYGILIAVQGLATLGYLSLLSETIYQNIPSVIPSLFDNVTQANTIIGVLSAIIDNIPVMFAVITMHPDMSAGEWLLVTLATGVGGSLLSIGSAAGVAVMGQSKGMYTFLGHLKWIWAIALGYLASIAVHLWLNSSYFNLMPHQL